MKARLGIGAAMFAMASIGSDARADGKRHNVSFEVLSGQDSLMSTSIIQAFESTEKFNLVAEKTTKAILQRDREDSEQLQKGVDFAITKKLIPSSVKLDPVTKISVTGKTASEVAKEIINGLGSAVRRGCVITLQGLSGTGKGTTAAMLKRILPNAITWSNGNIFRSLTLLATTYAEHKGVSLEEAITPKLLASYCEMLEFGKFNGKFDVRIKGLGHDLLVSEVCNTALKDPKVVKNIPTVAGVTQGEVINFVKDALKILTENGVTVLLEGREETLNHIRTPYRFELVLEDINVIGQRRAAQRMGAQAFNALMSQKSFMWKIFGTPSDSQVAAALNKALDEMVKE